MATPQSKVNVGLTSVILFFITLLTGLSLHVRTHSPHEEPHKVLIICHCAAGLLMVCFAGWHGIQFRKVLNAMRKRFLWFWFDTWIVILLICLAFLTGIAKIIVSSGATHMGLHHYVLGLVMSIAIIIHLIRGIPALNRLRKISR